MVHLLLKYPVIEYDLVVSKRYKRLSMIVKEGKVIVRARRKPNEEYVKAFLARNEKWIEKQISKDLENNNKFIHLAEGSQVNFLGGSYTIVFAEIKKPDISHDQIQIPLNKKTKVEVVKFLRRRAAEYLIHRTSTLAARHDLHPAKVSIRDTSSRWGSCSRQRNINLNWRLAFAPLEVADYVINHELAHLVHMNHSQRYWNKLQEIMPDYETWRKWLKQNSHSLQIK